MLLQQINQNQSGIGLKTTNALSPLKSKNPYKRNLSEFGSEIDLDEKLAEVVKANIKAVPLPRPLRIEARQRRRSLRRSRAESESAAEQVDSPEKPKKEEQKPQSEGEEEVSVQPGALTVISDEDHTPLNDKAMADEPLQLSDAELA